MSWQTQEWEEDNEVLLGDVAFILDLCKELSNVVARPSSHRAGFLQIYKQVSLLEKMALAIKRRPEMATPQIRTALVDVGRCLSNARDFTSKVSTANFVLGFLKTSSDGFKLQEISWKLSEAVQELSAALESSNLRSSGLRGKESADVGWVAFTSAASSRRSVPVFRHAVAVRPPLMVLERPPVSMVRSTVISSNRPPTRVTLNLARRYASMPTVFLRSGSLAPHGCTFDPHYL
ncbi:uncharacterized protein ACBT44_010202 isoform 2-T2 [Syngnathus typhle]